MVAHRGFTLIEIMITLAVLAFLLFLGLPSFTQWIQNTQIRTAAEGITSGLQIARNEAVRRNTSVYFAMGTGPGWTVQLASAAPTDPPIQRRSQAEGSSTVVVTITPNTTITVTFNGLGRIVTNADGSAPITAINVDSSPLPFPASRKLCVTLNSSGVIQMCDTQVAATDTRACRPANPVGC